MPNRDELIAHDRTITEIANQLNIDNLVYQSVENLRNSITNNSSIEDLEMSCFTGSYITGTVNQDYLNWVENEYKS
jgi:amidophosphoribosyltransferase